MKKRATEREAERERDNEQEGRSIRSVASRGSWGTLVLTLGISRGFL